MSRRPHLSQFSFKPVLIGAVALALTYSAISTVRYVAHNYRLHQDEARLRREITELNRDHEELLAVRDYVRSDSYVEEVARRVLGLVKPGETLVLVSSDATPQASPTPAPGAAGPSALPDDRSEWWERLFIDRAPTPTPTRGP